MTGGAEARPGLRSLLRRPAYRRLWTARTISQVGDVTQFTTLALLIVMLTGSALGVSAVVLAEIVPVLLLAPFAGSRGRRDSPAVAYAVAFGLSAGQSSHAEDAASVRSSERADRIGEKSESDISEKSILVTLQDTGMPDRAEGCLGAQRPAGVPLDENAAGAHLSPPRPTTSHAE